MRIVITHSIVVPLQPAEKCPSMKMPVGKFTLPLKVGWLNSYEKVVDDIDIDMLWGGWWCDSESGYKTEDLIVTIHRRSHSIRVSVN